MFRAAEAVSLVLLRHGCFSSVGDFRLITKQVIKMYQSDKVSMADCIITQVNIIYILLFYFILYHFNLYCIILYYAQTSGRGSRVNTWILRDEGSWSPSSGPCPP